MKDTNLPKSHADKFRLIIFLSYFAVVVTIVLSLWNAGFDPSKNQLGQGCRRGINFLSTNYNRNVYGSCRWTSLLS